MALDFGTYEKQRLRTQVDEIVIIGGNVKAEIAQHGNVIAGNNRRSFRQEAMLDAARQREFALNALLLHGVTMHLRIFQRHGHMSGELVEEAHVIGRKLAALRIEQLQHANNFTRMVLDRKTEQRLGPVIQSLVEAGIESLQTVSIVSIYKFAGDSHLSGDALAEGDADFLVVESGSGDGP